jgi:GT2 family glycosyltransferase
VAEAAVIIPHYNDVVRLQRCLAALWPQVGALAPGRVEVLVVDNASSESPGPLRALWPDLRIVTEPKKGAAEARNRGVAETAAPVLLFLDCDCLPAPDWLATALAVAPLADVTGGRVEVFDETPPPRSGAQGFETVFAFDNRGYVENRGFSVTANLVTRRDVFLATGPFVHGLSEDLDWCRRATARGFRLVYADGLRVGHPSRGDWAALSRKWRRLTDEGFGVNGRGWAARARWAARALAMPLSILAHAPRVLRHPALRDGGERARALATLARLRLTRMAWMLEQAVRG